jgi:hypothetical protein
MQSASKLRIFFIGLYTLLCAPAVIAQKVFESGDRWGNFKGNCIAVIEDDKIFKSNNISCWKDACIYIVEADKVYASANSFGGFRGDCVFIGDGSGFYTTDRLGNFTDALLYIVEGNRIYESVNNFSRGKCLYIFEENKVYKPFNPSGTAKDDCILIVEDGEISWLVLLAILARRF